MSQPTEEWGFADQVELELLEALEDARQRKPDPREFVPLQPVLETLRDKHRDREDFSDITMGVANSLLASQLVHSVDPDDPKLQITTGR